MVAYKRLFSTLVLFTSMISSHGVSAQRQVPGIVELAAPIDWGYDTVPIDRKNYPTVYADTTFLLQTSWIPGKDHKGMFRYKVRAFPGTPSAESVPKSILYDVKQVSGQVERIHKCAIGLELFDVNGFTLRRIPLILSRDTDDSGNTVALIANWSEQMDLSEYRQFLGSGAKSGSWSVDWNCE